MTVKAAAVFVMCAAALACGPAPDTTPAVATLDVSLSRPRVALGSPVEIHYRVTVAADAPNLGSRRVFVHFLDVDEELMWADDHDPPTPSASWAPGQVIEYTRTIFVPAYPYVGAAKMVAGLYAAGSNDRLKLTNEDRGDRSYKVVDFELLPQTENVFVIFKDGWHPAEVVEGADRVEWQWTKREATISFRNPKRDVTLFLQADNPATGPNAATQLTVQRGEEVIAALPISPETGSIRKVAISAAQLGADDMVELRFLVDKTFVPALEPAASNADPRELGARVFHAFIQ